MESLPLRPESQRRQTPRDSSPSPNTHASATTPAGADQASPSVLFNNPCPTRPSSQSRPSTDYFPVEPKRQAEEEGSDTEPRKCWICFEDETEDDETTSEWRSPCPCVLVAHEKCLLDWVADMEAPNSQRQAGGKPGKILCPQCKSEIRLQRPRSYVVDAVRAVNRLAGMCLLPGAIAFVGTAAVTTLSLVGRTQVYHIFGAQDGLRILAPLYQPPDFRDGSTAARLLHQVQQHWRLHLGLPLIPTVLLASRSTFADSFLPFIPLVFFVSSGRPQDDMLQFSWPPSAAFTVASLPYIRGIYNAYYERVWRPREQRWLKEVMPRANDGEQPEQDAQGVGAEPPNDLVNGDQGGDPGDEIEIELQLDVFADWIGGGPADNHEAIENPPVPIARGPGRPLNPGVRERDDNPVLVQLREEVAAAPNVPREPRQRGNRVRRERNLAVIDTVNVADSMLGALVFPSIAAAVGEALRYVLPKSWVTPPVKGKPTGFLQAKWGRSILGGCLFVALKDALMLYVRWKMAQNHRKRSVLDYDKSKAKSKPKRTARA